MSRPQRRRADAGVASAACLASADPALWLTPSEMRSVRDGEARQLLAQGRRGAALVKYAQVHRLALTEAYRKFDYVPLRIRDRAEAERVIALLAPYRPTRGSAIKDRRLRLLIAKQRA